MINLYAKYEVSTFTKKILKVMKNVKIGIVWEVMGHQQHNHSTECIRLLI